MKRTALITLILLSHIGFSQQFDWNTDGYVDLSGGGTYTNIDNTGINLQVSGLVNDVLLGSDLLHTGINNMQADGIMHTYSFTFSAPVDVKFTINEINLGNCWKDSLVFSGNPQLSDTAYVTLAGNVVSPVPPIDVDSPLNGTVKVRYTQVTNFTIQHGTGNGCNPGVIRFSAINFGSLASLDENIQQTGVSLFPNPAGASTTFRFDEPNGTLSLTDIYGKAILSSVQCSGTYELNTTGLSAGNYIYTYVVKGKQATGRLTVL